LFIALTHASAVGIGVGVGEGIGVGVGMGLRESVVASTVTPLALILNNESW
jgi:hypothetical protein